MSFPKHTQAIDTYSAFMTNKSMSQQEKSLLALTLKESGFQLKSKLGQSSYYGSPQIGATHYLGNYKNKIAILKIQGVATNVSEVSMIAHFAQQNQSKIIRPPQIYWNLHRNSNFPCDAFIAEFIIGPKVIQSGQLQSQKNIDDFFSLYQEYRKHSVPKKPWMLKPRPINFVYSTKQAWKLSKRTHPNDPRHEPNDYPLTIQAAQVLQRIYTPISLEFLHGHFSVEDLIYSGNEVVIFSNLFWKWQYPFYDAIFAYHWFQFTLQHVPNLSVNQIIDQRQLWLTAFEKLIEANSISRNRVMLNAALLERAIAGLILDSLFVDLDHPHAHYFTALQREEVTRLSSTLAKPEGY